MNKVVLTLLIFALSNFAMAEHKLGKSIESKLVDAQGKSVTAKLSKKKYVVFYYSAAWCPPCQRFTPKLVEFYNQNKGKNFELVFVSSDRDQRSMMGYMKKKKMTFPALAFAERRNEDVRKYAGRGIPFLAMVDENGKAVVKETAWGALDKIKKLVK